MSDARILIKGNEAIAFGAVDAGCRCYFGYPITPQNEIPEVLSAALPAVGGSFVQAESEIGSINMVLGAGACGTLAMTSSSSPGISLMQEGISYMAGSHVPGVIVNMNRGGPGLGDIGPSQGDYFQAVKGGGHGDYRTLVLAPATAQECYDLMFKAFALAFKYRNPVVVLGDAIVGQIKEPVRRMPPADAQSMENIMEAAKSWRVEGYGSRKDEPSPRLIKSVYLGDGELAVRNRGLMGKYAAMKSEVMAECLNTEEAELIVVAYGSMGRIVRSAVNTFNKNNNSNKVGLVRPITLYPFPDSLLESLAARGKRFLVIEQNTGQMVEDVRLAVRKHTDAAWHGVMPGLFIGADDLLQPIAEAMRENAL